MAKKVLFVPWNRNPQLGHPMPKGIGELTNRLKASAETQGKGFTPNDLLTEPAWTWADGEKKKKKYDHTEKLREFLTNEYQIYICGHCNRGSDHLSPRITDISDWEKVTADNLVEQLKAHCLPEKSQARIKLWACYAALGKDQGAVSFASRFSKKMHQAGFTGCKIFAYSHSVVAQYDARKEGEGESARRVPRKRVNVDQSNEERLRAFFVDKVKTDKILLARTEKSRMVQATWDHLMKKHNQNVDATIFEILNNCLDLFFGKKEEEATSGSVRASSCRYEFTDGVGVAAPLKEKERTSI